MNLFLTGAPGCGKSTAIAEALRESGLLPSCGGYRTARIFSENGRLRGFAQFPAAEEPEFRSDRREGRGHCPGTDLVEDGPVPHLFLDFSEEPPFRAEVFTDYTVGALAPRGKKLLVIDEIGGRELGMPEVAAAYLAALKGPVPCIGVLKCEEHARHFAYGEYLRFRERMLAETDTELLTMTEADRRKTKERVLAWLEGLFPERTGERS